MSIPALEERVPWALLEPEAKRARLLRAAGEIFDRDGLATPMPAVAAAAGAGVGSVYRQFPSKRDLVAELVVDRLEQIAEGARQAGARTGNRWEALTEMLWRLLEHKSCDEFFGEAMATVADHPAVVAAHERANGALDQLLVDTRAEGRLRADATPLDLRLIFTATRASRQLSPEAWRRMLELLIDSLDGGRTSALDGRTAARWRRAPAAGAAGAGASGTRRPV